MKRCWPVPQPAAQRSRGGSAPQFRTRAPAPRRQPDRTGRPRAPLAPLPSPPGPGAAGRAVPAGGSHRAGGAGSRSTNLAHSPGRGPRRRAAAARGGGRAECRARRPGGCRPSAGSWCWWWRPLRPAPPPGPLAEACSPRSRHGLSQRGGQPRPRALPLGTAAGGAGGSPSPRSRPPLMAAAGVAQSKINPHTASSPHVSSACRPAPHPLAERAPPTPPIDARLFGENG